MRITPAHAGTTLQIHVLKGALWDHPRSRGDHFKYGIPQLGIYGSPPLTRGPLMRQSDLRRLLRITPAHAGTTATVISRPSP